MSILRWTTRRSSCSSAIRRCTASACCSSRARRTGWVATVPAPICTKARTSATGIPVRLTVDGDVVDTVTVDELDPAERLVIGIQGPACTKSVKAEADPDGVIVESSEADNAHEVACSSLPSA